MAYTIEDFDQLGDFKEVSYASGSSDITLVAGIKLVLHDRVVNYLGINKDDIGRMGKSRARICMNDKKKELMIYKQTGNVGNVLGGKLSAVELYSASTGKKILKLIDRELKGSGTVGFKDIKFEKTTKNIPFVIVKLESYAAKQGVFVEETEKLNN